MLTVTWPCGSQRGARSVCVPAQSLPCLYLCALLFFQTCVFLPSSLPILRQVYSLNRPLHTPSREQHVSTPAAAAQQPPLQTQHEQDAARAAQPGQQTAAFRCHSCLETLATQTATPPTTLSAAAASVLDSQACMAAGPAAAASREFPAYGCCYWQRSGRPTASDEGTCK